jgi:hypothetical protein
MSLSTAGEPERLSDLRRIMVRLADTVAALPAGQRDLAGNALLNVTVETLVEEVGTAEAARLLRRVAALVDHGMQPPESGAINLTRCDA